MKKRAKEQHKHGNITFNRTTDYKNRRGKKKCDRIMIET
jgi:hypothetical protein